MRAWLLTVGEPLPVFDYGSPRLFRTGLLARVMSGRGHEVTWWTSAFDHYGKRHRVEADTVATWEGGELRLLRSVGYRTNVSLRRIAEHKGIARKFARSAPTLPPPDVIVASFPTIELADVAVQFGGRGGIPVVVDVRDLWPDALISLVPRPLRWAGRIAVGGQTRRARRTLVSATAIAAVSPSYLAWGLKMASRSRRPGDAIFPLGYVPHSTSLAGDREAGLRLEARGVDSERLICWYVGSFGRTYDLSPVITAAAQLQQRDDVQFVFSGDGELAQRWHDLARGLDNVVFTGWIDANEINWLRRRAAVGLQPYAEGAPQGLANKLFEYMSAGMPVVSSLRGENAELLRELACGITYPPGDAAACLEALRSLVDDQRLREDMAKRASAAFTERFDGAVVLEQFADHLEAVAGTQDD